MVLSETAELMGLSMRMTEDQLSRDALAASATQYTCTGGTNGDSPTNLSLSDVDTVTTTLLSNDAYETSGHLKSWVIDLETVVAFS
jgi:hypothetical protein